MPKDFEIKNSFNLYIHKVLHTISPESRINQHALNNVNMMAHHVVDMLIAKGELLKRHHKVYSARLVQSSVRLVLARDLAKHAVSEGTKSFSKYNASTSGTRADRISKTTRTGNFIPPSLIRRILNEKSTYSSISDGACVYFAAVIEYLLAEILDVSSSRARLNGHATINTRDVMFSINNDNELAEVFTGVFNGGVMPHLSYALLPKKK
jgi:histone H3/H4